MQTDGIIINTAKQKGLEKIYLHSQMGSIDFYQSLKFIQKGEMFQEADIDHVLMVLEDEQKWDGDDCNVRRG